MNYKKDFTDFSVWLCREAGKILMSGFRSKTTVVSYKSRTDMVTDIDRKSEEFITSIIKKEFPDHSIIAEEGGSYISGDDFKWYVDPLDATNNFAHGIPFFCVSIGLWSKKENSIISGVVCDPFHDEIFSASLGKGSFCNEEKIHVSNTSDIGYALLSTGFPYAKDDMNKNNLRQFNKFLPKIQCIRRLGSAALDLCYLACGRIDGYWEPMLHPWDTAAGSLIVTEAGGRVTKYNGDPFDPNFPEILASNGHIHTEMLKIINAQD